MLRPQQSLTESGLLTAFHEYLQNAVRMGNYRVQRKEVNDFLVVAVCDVLDKRMLAEGEGLPFQFPHGTREILILISSKRIQHICSHSLKPFRMWILYFYILLTLTLAKQVTLHQYTPMHGSILARCFPMLSREGQETVLKQALELAPTSKILWSTDGHFFPETYWLANKQFRSTLENALMDGV